MEKAETEEKWAPAAEVGVAIEGTLNEWGPGDRAGARLPEDSLHFPSGHTWPKWGCWGGEPRVLEGIPQNDPHCQAHLQPPAGHRTWLGR